MDSEDSGDDISQLSAEDSEADDELSANENSDDEFDSDDETHAKQYQKGLDYWADQDDLLAALEDAVKNENVDCAKKIIDKIDNRKLSEGSDELVQLLLDNFNQDMFDLFQKINELKFSSTELDKILDDSIANDKCEIVEKILEEIHPDENELFYRIFETECDTCRVLILRYCFRQYSAQPGFEDEIKKLFQLIDAEDEDIHINQVITSLLYENHRHHWNNLPCKLRRELIKLLDHKKSFVNWSRQQFENYIRQQETENETFFGVDLSDDSDSEDERKILAESDAIRSSKLTAAKKLATKAEIDKIKPSQRLGSNSLIGRASPQYDLQGRAVLKKPDAEQVDRDLQTLNEKFAAATKNGELEKLINSLQTKFVVMQVRGLTYSTTGWSAPARRFHRKLDEIDQPLYASAVYKASNLDFNYPAARDKIKCKDPMTQNDLQVHADKIKKFLIDLRVIRDVNNNEKTYSSCAHLLQETYTNDYDNYPAHLTELGFDGTGNPFVSTSDRPYHALRYAFGIKPYKGHEEERLRPRWQSNGRAERNKSGKVYLSIHPLTDYGRDGPLSVTDLVWQGQMFCDNQIIAERETTFSAYLPANRVKHQMIAKYPSFHRPYKNIYQIKYGFDKELYELFQYAIKYTAPHSAEHKAAKKLLGDWLCVFNEVKLIEFAQNYSQANNLVLIYRHPNGKFGYSLAPDSPFRNGQSQETRDAIKQKRAEREAKLPFYKDVRAIKESLIETNTTVDELMQMFDRLSIDDEAMNLMQIYDRLSEKITPLQRQKQRNLLSEFNEELPVHPKSAAALNAHGTFAPQRVATLPTKKTDDSNNHTIAAILRNPVPNAPAS